jgi:uncharacterized coiled-coil protein SlyX
MAFHWRSLPVSLSPRVSAILLSCALLLLFSTSQSRADSITLPSSPDPWQQLVQTWNDGKPLMLRMPLSVTQLEQRLAEATTYSAAQEQTINALADSLSKRDNLLSASDRIRDQQSSYISNLEGSLASSQASTDQISKDLTSAKTAAQVILAENRLLKIGGSVLLVGLAVLGGYEGGHALKWW